MTLGKRRESGKSRKNFMGHRATNPANPYIISPRVDLLLIVGAVILCPALLLPAAAWTSPYTVWLVVTTFGAVGHHFPSFLRTYGDREIFQTYRTRLIVAPILLFAVTLGFSLNGLHGMLLIAFCWAIWHGMMQHFGFMRIYDIKVRSMDKTTARLDWWISFSWFGLCLALSPHQGGSLLDALYNSGLPIVPVQHIELVRSGLISLTAVVTLIYIGHSVIGNHPRSWMKLGLLASTCGYVYLVRVITKDPFLSVALFELLHDIQYLAIVWAFNRRQVEKGGGNVIMRFLYRPSPASVAFYVGACLLYGAFAFTVFTKVESGMVKSVLEAVLITSGLLHFYYDGFIWKLRQNGTRSGLGLDQKQQEPAAYRPPLWRGASHVAIVLVLALLLARFEMNNRDVEPLEKARAIASAVPDNPTSLNNLGLLLMNRGDYDEAVPVLRRALEIQPELSQAKVSLSDSLAMLSLSYLDRGLVDEAIALRREALSVEPDSAERLNDLAVLLGQTGSLDEAEAMLRKAISLDPTHEIARGNLEALRQMR